MKKLSTLEDNLFRGMMLRKRMFGSYAYVQGVFIAVRQREAPDYLLPTVRGKTSKQVN
jgi:hypothetical protein